jgi:hypothetical protein
MDEQLIQIRDQFFAELLGLRQRLAGSWDALNTALKPTLDVLGSPRSTIVDHAHVSSSWEMEARSLGGEIAGDLSLVLIRLSDALTACYRAQRPREVKIAEVISTFYIDVQRPLWAAHPALQPFDA